MQIVQANKLVSVEIAKTLAMKQNLVPKTLIALLLIPCPIVQ